MKKFAKYLRFSFTILVLFCSIFVLPVSADDDSERLNELENQIKEYEEKIAEARGKQKTLASTIYVLDTQISATTSQIQKTTIQLEILRQEVENLSIKIDQLDTYLTETAVILQARIEETYKRLYLPSFEVLFLSNDFPDLLSRIKYLKTAQANDKELMYQMEETKQDFDNQKDLKETKQKELEEVKAYLDQRNQILSNQKAAKQDLLYQTQNDEKKFQQLLASARNEYESIQAIIAGRGDEEEVKEVKAGDKIASVIVGSSCNSSGTHLHFTIAQGGNALNPFSYLKGIDHENCSGPGACSEADPFNPSGSWNWPLNGPIRMNQGYGDTWAVKNTWVGQIYSFHNGIDITGSSNDIKAVADGTLYRGSYGGSGGCRLRYVRVDHKDSDLETFYLHVNY